ncbi:BTB/POZ domain-containing protein 6-B-like [Paramacrobiotus metropolitanus]|uniref:BTB/POZ domain-containing protein 6-B-like n=1 Tax=Paramacrobiotus metropolitanus TaxID=2943436 RepID=UPI002445D912|nr:BTB/POZ domain-containing protein 6-B-like [Paramacrobiotus metropolitanus]
MSHILPVSPAVDWRRTARGVNNLLKHVLATGYMADVQFAVGREHGTIKIFQAHKFILSLNSDVFDAMFNGDFAESREKPVEVIEILPEAFSVMLGYMYTGSAQDSLRMENVFQTIYCADKYNLPLLMDECLQFVGRQLTQDNCLASLENVKHFGHDTIAAFIERCLEFVDIYTEAVLQSEQFCAISQETLKMILERNKLSADENSIYTAVEKWAIEACHQNSLIPSTCNRRQMLGAALFCVRFPLLADSQLVNGPAKSQLLLESELLAIYKYKHAVVKPPLPFSTEPRTGCQFPGFRCNEQVFVKRENRSWIIGEIGTGTTVKVRGGSMTINSPDQLVRAADILKNGKEILVVYNGWWNHAKYVSGAAEGGRHVVRVGDRNIERAYVCCVLPYPTQCYCNNLRNESKPERNRKSEKAHWPCG